MRLRLAFLAGVLLLSPGASGQTSETDFNDGAIAHVKHPAWFKESFLDLESDFNEAVESGKLGLLLFVSTQGCSYCQLFLKESLGDPAIAARVQAHFDTLGLEIFDDSLLTDFSGNELPVKDFALEQGVQFAPTLLFFGLGESGVPQRLLRLTGYYEPARFSLALDFLADGHYTNQGFKDFIASRAQTPKPTPGKGHLIPDPLFQSPPYALDRGQIPGERALLVIFESDQCPRCPRFHREVIQDPDLRAQLANLDLVRLDALDTDTPVLTPDGHRTNPAQWYKDLGFTDLPALVFVNESGATVLTTDTLVLKSRMGNSLGFLRDRAYEKGWTYQRYARTQALAKHSAPPVAD